MSDKETAPQRVIRLISRLNDDQFATVNVGVLRELIAVECTAPAPQNPWKEVIADACCAICTDFYPDDPQKSLISLIHWQVQTALDPRVSEAAAKLLAATPQVTPTCKDCDEAAAHAYSDATSPGFFSPKCKKHREGASEQALPTPDPKGVK